MHLKDFFLPLLICTFTLTSLPAQAQKLEISFSNIDPESESLYIQVLDIEEEVVSSHIIDAREGAVLTITDIKPGEYWIRVYHDLNGNGELDVNYLGIPKEPYGFSNNVRPVFGPPDPEDMLFKVSGNTRISIELK